MKVNYKTLLLTFALFVLLIQTGKSQEIWHKLYDFPIDRVLNVSSDSYNNLYISNEKGHIYKYDSNGKKVSTFSPTKNSPITQLQGNRNVNIFAFYNNYQEYKILSRFLTEISTNKIPNDKVGFAKLATLSSDNGLWIVDESDFSLKKINLKFNQLEVNSPLQGILNLSDYNFSYLKEYNSSLYLADRNSGILVFDNLGNFKTKIPGKDITYFSFFQDYIYFLSGEKLILINLRTGKEQQLTLPNEAALYVIINSGKVFFIAKELVTVFQTPAFIKKVD